MNKLKVYLDTSIINFLYADDSPEYKKATKLFFETVVQKKIIDAYISPIVIDELNRTPDNNHKAVLLSTFQTYTSIQTLTTEPAELSDIAFLRDQYINSGIIPPKNYADAFHIAYSTKFQMDVLLSWNFHHLANINKEQKIIILNKSLGYYYPFRMANPLEVYFE